MVHSKITKLVALSSAALGPSLLAGTARLSRLEKWGKRGGELAELLEYHNGFYAYESALLVRPLEGSGPPLGILEWNTMSLWKAHYWPELAQELAQVLFFAEDVFGCQFGIYEDAIHSFEPETGMFEIVSESLEEWAETVLNDFEYQTGYPLAHAWQMQNGPLVPGTRLLPKVPFTLGGQYTVENLYALNDVEGMRFGASIAKQLRDVPNGADVILEIRNNNRPQEERP